MNWNPPSIRSETKLQAPFFVEEDVAKLAFAAALLKTPNDPYKAALAVVYGDTIAAMWAANNWPNDPIVKEEQNRLIAEQGEIAFLPSKAQIAREVYELSQKDRLSQSDKIRLDSLMSYSKLLGYYVEAGKGGTANVKVEKAGSIQVIASDLDEKL